MKLPVRAFDQATRQIVAVSVSGSNVYEEAARVGIETISRLLLVEAKDALSREPDPFTAAMQQPRAVWKKHPNKSRPHASDGYHTL